MAGLYANPFVDPDAFDFCVIAGTKSMGILKWNGAVRKYVWDKKQGAGAQGATLTYRGWDLSDGIKFQFLMWKREQIDFCYSVFIPLLQYDATKANPKPVNIQHPTLMANDVFAVVTQEIGDLTPAGNMLFTLDVALSEYRPPAKKNATSTPNGSATSKPRAGSRGGSSSILGNKPTAQDAQDAEIQRLVAEFNKPT